jgi:hypothetical protein
MALSSRIGQVHSRSLCHRCEKIAGRGPSNELAGGLTPIRPPMSRGQAEASRGGGEVVRETTGEASWPSGCGGLDFGCWSPHGTAPHTYGGSMLRWSMVHGQPWPPQAPRPRNSSVPACRSAQSSGLCPQPRLVSLRLGGGAAPGHWVTEHPEGERERRSKPTVRLRVLGPEVPPQSRRYI